VAGSHSGSRVTQRWAPDFGRRRGSSLGNCARPAERVYLLFANSEFVMKRLSNHQVTLKPQDLVVLLKLATVGEKTRTFSELASDLVMSASEVHSSVGRAMEARLVHMAGDTLRVTKAALKEFVIHGAKYAFPATFGAATRGLPTSHAAPPLQKVIVQPKELPPVWPDPTGPTRGMTLYPLYPTVPQAARSDPALYENLALFDALRSGAARERQVATELLVERLG